MFRSADLQDNWYFQGFQVSSFDFSTLCTSLPHDLLKAKVLSLLNGVSTDSHKHTYVRHIRRDFSPTRSMTRITVGFELSYVKLLLSSWKIYTCNRKFENQRQHTNATKSFDYTTIYIVCNLLEWYTNK